MQTGISRNSEIQRSLEESKVPILPFELVLARSAMERHISKQAELGYQMGQAMEQSSETWHDNAPAEAISNESKTLAQAAEQTINVIKYAEIYTYEATPEDGITLGSVIDVRYGKATTTSRFFLTGVSRELPSEILNQIGNIDDIDVITLASPVGKVLFGRLAGETVDFSAPNGRRIVLSIEAVRQLTQPS